MRYGSQQYQFGTFDRNCTSKPSSSYSRLFSLGALPDLLELVSCGRHDSRPVPEELKHLFHRLNDDLAHRERTGMFVVMAVAATFSGADDPCTLLVPIDVSTLQAGDI